MRIGHLQATLSRLALPLALVFVFSAQPAQANQAASAAVVRGDAFLAKNQLDEALAAYKQATIADPESGIALAKHAYASSRLHLTSADSEFKRALQLAKNDVYVLDLLAISKTDCHDYKGVVDCRSRELELFPGIDAKARTEWLLIRADAYGRLHQRDLAFKDLDAAIKLSPRNYHCWLMRALSYASLAPSDYTKALSDVNQALQENPDSAEVLFHRANILRMSGHVAQAVSSYERACKLDPENLEIRTTFEDLKLGNNIKPDATMAMKYCTQAIAMFPNNPDFYVRRATAFETSGQFKKAADDSAHAFSLDHNEESLRWHVNNIRSHDHEVALQLVNNAMRLKPNSASLLALRGVVYADKKEFDKAFNDLDTAVKSSPNDPELWNELSDCAYRSGQYDKALASVNRAIELDRKNAGLLMHRANILFMSGKHKESVAAFQAASQVDPGNLYNRCRYEIAKLSDGKHPDADAAIVCFTNAIKKDPKNSEYVYWRASAFEYKKDFRSAIADLNKAFSLDHNCSILKDHVELLRANNQSALALNLLDEALSEQTRAADLYAIRASLRVESKTQVAAGLKDLEVALRIDPTNVLALKCSAAVKTEQLEFDGALVDCAKVLKDLPNDQETLRRRAFIYRELGRPRECLTDLEHLCRVAPAEKNNQLSNLGWCHESLGDGKAHDLYHEAIAHGDKPTQERAKLNLAKTLEHEKRFLEAVQIYKQIVVTNPQPRIYDEIAGCYENLKDWHKAIDALSSAIRIDPNYAVRYAERAEAFVQLPDYKEAIEDYTVAIKKGREHAAKYLQARAQVYEKLGKNYLAADDRKAASSIVRDVLDDR